MGTLLGGGGNLRGGGGGNSTISVDTVRNHNVLFQGRYSIFWTFCTCTFEDSANPDDEGDGWVKGENSPHVCNFFMQNRKQLDRSRKTTQNDGQHATFPFFVWESIVFLCLSLVILCSYTPFILGKDQRPPILVNADTRKSLPKK